MSEQDANDPDSSPGEIEKEGSADVEDSTKEDGTVIRESDHDEPVEETLEEIAKEPDDVERVLSNILREQREETGDSSSEESEETHPESAVDRGDVTVEELSEMVEAASPNTIARIIATLRDDVSQLETELEEQRERADDLESRLKRKQADFQNYKKRQEKRMEEEKQRATEDLVERLLDVRDNLKRAIEQDEDTPIRDSVESTLKQFDQQFERENVEPIDPGTGESVDPQRHEVLATVESDEPEDSIADVHRSGYEMAGKVLRPAQVTVSDGSDE